MKGGTYQQQQQHTLMIKLTHIDDLREMVLIISLNCVKYVNNVCVKANRTLGLLNWNLKQRSLK
jgi:hypothetical protein